MRRSAWIFLFGLALTGCGGGNPYLDQSLKPAELQGKDKAWFEKNWGAPSGKATRFFGGETWTYYRIAGGKSGLPLFNFTPNHTQVRQRGKTVRLQLLRLLTSKFLLKLVRTQSTAKVIGLPTDIFRDRYSPWNKHQTLGILDHLILTGGKTFRLPLAFKSSNCPPNKEVQDNEQPKNKENSIHSGICFLAPQSYGTGPPLSRTPTVHC
jgi:hypothetical protein